MIRKGGSYVGTLCIGGVETHVLFDTGATHSFVSPYMIGKGLFQMGTEDDPCIVNAAGGQVMHSLGRVKDIPIVIQYRVMPMDLVVVCLKNHEVILGMDWLGKNQATLDCHRGRVQFETGCGPPIRFQGIRLTSGCLVISAVQVERMLEKGCEAFLITIATKEVVGAGDPVTSQILNRIIGTAMVQGNVLVSLRTSRQAFHSQIRRLRT